MKLKSSVLNSMNLFRYKIFTAGVLEVWLSLSQITFCFQLAHAHFTEFYSCVEEKHRLDVRSV